MTQALGTSQGTFFDTKDMKPLVDNDAFRKGLEFLKESSKYGPPDELNMGRERHSAAVRLGKVRPESRLGRCWRAGDRSQDVEGHRQDRRNPHARRQGSAELDTGKLQACTKESCPNAIDGVNHAPYAAFGGWSGGVNAKAAAKTKDAAYAFFSYLSQPAQSGVDVTIGATGFNPYRTSQLSYGEAWKKGGMSEKAAGYYLGAIKDSLNSPNMILDLRIPQNQKYQQVVLDETVSRFLSGEIDETTAIKTIFDGWVDLNDQLGKDEQLKFYKGTLGVNR